MKLGTSTLFAAVACNAYLANAYRVPSSFWADLVKVAANDERVQSGGIVAPEHTDSTSESPLKDLQELCLATSSGEDCVSSIIHAVQHPKHEESYEDKTIVEFLADNPHFTKLNKLVNYDEKIVSALNDTSANLTFFAFPDSALPRRRRGRHGHDSVGDATSFYGMSAEDMADCTVGSELESTALSCQHAVDTFARLVSVVEDADAALFQYGMVDEDHDHDHEDHDHDDEDHDDEDHDDEDHDDDDDDDDEDDEKKKRRRKGLKKILRAVLKYHVLPDGLPASELIKNTTHGTALALNDGSLDGEALRLRVAPTFGLGKSFTVNLYARAVKTDIKTKNGVIHVVNHPLFPPGSIFQQLFLGNEGFSIATSALQRVGLDSALEWRYERDDDEESDFEGSVEGTPVTTFFAPSNRAFAKLPAKLKLFLFSPFGENVLKKILQLHIVPEIAFHSDWAHNATSDDDEDDVALHGGHKAQHALQGRACSDFSRPRDAPSYAMTYALPTLLSNYSLSVVVEKFDGGKRRIPGLPRSAPRTVLSVNGQVVSVPDVPSRNGAVHLVGSIVNPKKGSKGGESEGVQDEATGWEDWEEWLVDWANEN